MKEFDFDTEEGREELKQYINEVVNNEDKTELALVLYSMLELLAKHEIKFMDLRAMNLNAATEIIRAYGKVEE